MNRWDSPYRDELEKRLDAWERELETNRHGFADFAPTAINHIRGALGLEHQFAAHSQTKDG